MTTGSHDLIENLGGELESPKLTKILHSLNLMDVQDDPPFRRYVGSKSKGLSLLFNDRYLLDVQFFVEPTRSYQACTLPLPYGLTRDISQKDVHILLGTPDEYDATFSKYLKDDGRVKLIIEYAKSGLIRYISTSAASGSNSSSIF